MAFFLVAAAHVQRHAASMLPGPVPHADTMRRLSSPRPLQPESETASGFIPHCEPVLPARKEPFDWAHTAHRVDAPALGDYRGCGSLLFRVSWHDEEGVANLIAICYKECITIEILISDDEVK